MIPPVASSILETNPQFASLHRHLTTKLLNRDASTCATTEAHATVSEALREHLLRGSKHELIRSSLRNVAVGSEGRGTGELFNLPHELRELVGTISMLLDEAPSMNLNADDYDLLKPDIDAFHNNSQDIADAISEDLHRQHELLCKMASSATSPKRDSFSSRHAANTKRSLLRNPASVKSSTSPNSLPALLEPLLPTFPNAALQSALTALSNATLQHSTVHRTLLSTTLTQLERTVHGLYARHTRARSAHLNAVAIALAKRAEVAYLQSRDRIYSSDVQRALGNYHLHLERVGTALEEREGMLRAVMKEYDDVGLGEDGSDGGKGQKGLMREVGRRYGEVLQEIESLKEEIVRLESRRGAGKDNDIGGTKGRVPSGTS